jgi:hypothetical protein
MSVLTAPWLVARARCPPRRGPTRGFTHARGVGFKTHTLTHGLDALGGAGCWTLLYAPLGYLAAQLVPNGNPPPSSRDSRDTTPSEGPLSRCTDLRARRRLRLSSGKNA